jgi:hypothetical protein
MAGWEFRDPGAEDGVHRGNAQGPPGVEAGLETARHLEYIRSGGAPNPRKDWEP